VSALLGAGDVHVWYRHTAGVSPEELDAAGARLSGDERARRDRFLSDRHRRDFVLAHDLLRRSLSRYRDVAPPQWRFETTDNGRPLLSGPAAPDGDGALSFNLSHTDGVVACAVARDLPLGVDVERLDGARDVERLAELCFSPRELAALRCCGDGARARFFELWTLKDAKVKAIGAGLTQALDAISFDFDGPGRIAFTAPPELAAGEWRFALYAPSPQVRLAVAARVGRDRSVRWEAREERDTAALLAPLRATGWSAPAAAVGR
jgi:4'-phosphopantetheinyl transferase